MEITRVGQGGACLDNGMSTRVNDGAEIQVRPLPDKTVENEDGSKKVSEGEVKKAVEKLNKFLEDDHIKAEYSHHEKLKDLMIKIVNTETKEVILEIPPKKILDMVAKMCEMVGILVDKKA